MKKKIISILLCLLIWTSLANIGQAATAPDWRSLYANQLKSMMNNPSFDMWGDTYISIVDLDLDGIPEFIVGMDYRSSSEIYGAYTISNNKVVELDWYLNGKKVLPNVGELYGVMGAFLKADGYGATGLKLYKHKTKDEAKYIGVGGSSSAVGAYLSYYEISMIGKQIKLEEYAGLDEYEDYVYDEKTDTYYDEYVTTYYDKNNKKISESAFNKLTKSKVADYNLVNYSYFVNMATGEYYEEVPTPTRVYYDYQHPSAFSARLQPSTWAKSSIETARKQGLVPDDLDRGYHNSITRDDFSKLAIQYLSTYYNVSRSQLPSMMKMVKNSSKPFNDTNSEEVTLAYNLGIVSGKGDGIFDPNGKITRQEAAVMLTKLAKLTDKQSKNGTLAFKDKAKISKWASDSVKYITGVKHKNTGSAVLGSAGQNQFDPLGSYTREQAIISFSRLLES